MTTTLFIVLAIICCTVSSALTEGIKQWFKNQETKNYSANLIALINAAVVGCGGTAIAYVLMGIPFTLANILCLVMMCGVVWLGSMIGYDKVVQLVRQIASTKVTENKIEE
jgi:hypothetical protein